MEFVRKPGYWDIKSDPQLVGEVCQALKLQLNRELVAKDLVDASRSEDAPLHSEFEWNDDIASEKYRELQAGRIIRSVSVKISQVPTEVTQLKVKITEKKGETVRFFHSVNGKGYESLEIIIQNEEKYKKLSENFVRDIGYLQEKYEMLRSYYASFFEAMDEVINKVN